MLWTKVASALEGLSNQIHNLFRQVWSGIKPTMINTRLSVLTYYHERELKSLLDKLSVYLIRQVGKAHIASLLWVDKLEKTREPESETVKHTSNMEGEFTVAISYAGTVKVKGIRFIVLYPPKCSHDPSQAGTLHTETNSIPRGIFLSSWQHIAHKL